MYLRAGKSPKEIAGLLCISVKAVYKILDRHEDARQVFEETLEVRWKNPRLRIAV